MLKFQNQELRFKIPNKFQIQKKRINSNTEIPNSKLESINIKSEMILKSDSDFFISSIWDLEFQKIGI